MGGDGGIKIKSLLFIGEWELFKMLIDVALATGFAFSTRAKVCKATLFQLCRTQEY